MTTQGQSLRSPGRRSGSAGQACAGQACAGQAWPGQAGSASLELAIIAPVLLLLIALVVMGGRFAMGTTAITGVAGVAARDASLARNPAAARAAATSSALATLAAQNLHCQGGPTVQVDTTGFAAAPGTPATLSVDVTCVVLVNGLAVPGLPSTRTVHERALSPIDPFRSTP